MSELKPKISIILIVYDMPEQAMNTIYSLSSDYQKNIDAQQYEIIVVENSSGNNLDPDAVKRTAPNSRYFLRDEPGVSPVPAINYGFEQCQGETIGLMIDGARMLTPRVIEYALLARKADQDSLTVVPGYNLGPTEQQFSVKHGYNKKKERQLLEQCNWRQNGYRLFDISSIGGANPTGFIDPLLESNCMFASREAFKKIGYADTNFTYPGGGSINLHMFRSLGMLKETNRYFLMLGEGSFHQLHGGVTTTNKEDRDKMLKLFSRQLNALWGVFSVLKREAILLGAVSSHAQKFLHYSSTQSLIRFDRLDEKNAHHWLDDHQRIANN